MCTQGGLLWINWFQLKILKKYTTDTRNQLTLIQMCETRWIEHRDSITRSKELYLTIYYALKQSESNSSIETSKNYISII